MGLECEPAPEPLHISALASSPPGAILWVVMVGGVDGELRPWHYMRVEGYDGELRPWHNFYPYRKLRHRLLPSTNEPPSFFFFLRVGVRIAWSGASWRAHDTHCVRIVTGGCAFLKTAAPGPEFSTPVWEAASSDFVTDASTVDKYLGPWGGSRGWVA